MPHSAAALIRSWLQSDTEPAARAFQLLSAHIQPLVSALKDDGVGLHYSALISLMDAINGIREGYFSWATVKLYYACFYSVRLILAANSITIFYVSAGKKTGKPFSLVTTQGGQPKRENGLTHEVIWKILDREFQNHPLLNPVGSEKAFEWMKNLREEVNYRNPKFQDPMVPPHFSRLSAMGLDSAIRAYCTDTTMLYTFDPDHAAFAFPIECLKQAQSAMKQVTWSLDPQDQKYISDIVAKQRLPDIFLTSLVSQGSSL